MQNNNSFAVANAFKRHFARCEVNDAAEEESPDLTLHIGDLSGFVPSLELQIQWGLVPGYSLDISMVSPTKFKARLISPELESNDNFALKNQLEVMLEKLVTPDRREIPIVQTVWKVLVDMGFDEEVSRLATIEAEGHLEQAIDIALPISAKIRAENLLAQHVKENDLEFALGKYFEARFANLTSFCLLCDNIVENHTAGKSCVCHRSLCEWQFKQLGLVPCSPVLTPRVVLGLPPASGIISLSAGDQHSVACFENGKVYSWGKGTSGQLGDGKMRSSAVAVEAHPDSPLLFKKVAAGLNFTVALTNDGRLYVWGSGSAELGLGREEETVVPTPFKIEAPSKGVSFIDISVANRMCFAITSCNEAYSWGQQEEHCWAVPTRIYGFGARSIAAHQESSVCVDMEGQVRIWSSFYHTFLLVDMKKNVPARHFSHAVFVFGRRLLASTHDDAECVLEYALEQDQGRWTLDTWRGHLRGVDNYVAGPTYAVLAQRGVVQVAGTGSEVMCRDTFVESTYGIQIPHVRYAQHLAAGTQHVVCVAVGDDYVGPEAAKDLAHNLSVYQWGRDGYAANTAVECKAEVLKKNEREWAELADEVRELTEHRQKLLVDQYEGFMPYAKPSYHDEDEMQDQVDNNEGQEVQEVVLNDEKRERDVARDILNTCYEVRDALNVQLKLDQSQLVIDLHHPALLVCKILDENSVLRDVNIKVDAKDHNGNTALMLAMKGNDYKLFAKLMKVGSDLAAMNNDFEFPLDIAVTCGGSYAKSFVVALVEKGATTFNPTHRQKILAFVAAAAEYFPKLAKQLKVLQRAQL